MEDIAGLMLYSAHQIIPAQSGPGPFTANYGGKSLEESGEEPWALTDQQKKFLTEDKVRHVLIMGLKDTETAVRWNNRMQALAENTGFGIPANNSSDPRHGSGSGAEFMGITAFLFIADCAVLLLAIWLISRSVSSRIRHLSKTVQKVQDGKLETLDEGAAFCKGSPDAFRDGCIRVNGIASALQYTGVSRFKTKPEGICRNIGTGFVNNADHSQGDTAFFDFQPIGTGKMFKHLSQRIRKTANLKQAFRRHSSPPH